MLPKSERLTKEDFLGKRPKVFFRGVLFDAALFAKNDTKTVLDKSVSESIQLKSRFACVTAKKTFKRAVDRNLIKRRIFNCVKLFPLSNQYSIVFYPKKGSITVPYSHLHEEIKSAFDTLH